MTTPNGPADITFRATTPPGAGRYEVIHEGQAIGTVGRFTMGAGQFGSSWMATAPSGRKSSRFRTREAAAAWLLEHHS